MPATLEERVELLESAIGSAIAPDSFSPSAGQTIDAQGRVTYDFDGHVRARGVDLTAATSDTPFEDQQVRWLKASDGSYVAFMSGHTGIGADPNSLDYMKMQASSAVLGLGMAAELVTHAPASLGSSSRANVGVRLVVDPSDIVGEGLTRKLLDGNAASDYLLTRGEHAFFYGSNVGVANTATVNCTISNAVYDVTGVPDGGGAYKTQRNTATQWYCRKAGIYLAIARFGVTAAGGFGNHYYLYMSGVQQDTFQNSPNKISFLIRPFSMAVGDTVNMTATNVTGVTVDYDTWLIISRLGSTAFLS